jgi:hypothetical protein
MPTKVGIITSTTFSGTELETAFNSGWGGNGPGGANEVVVQAGGVYDADNIVHSKLRDGVNTLNNSIANGGSDMIVAFGGLITAHAVVKRSKKPFIVLVGHLPDNSDFSLTDNENYLGGIDLHTASSNIERRDALVAQFNLTPTQVALIYNPNSRTGRSEYMEWMAHGSHIAVAGVSGDNDQNDFSNAFDKAHRLGATGVVLAGDPFFAIKKIQMINAANTAFSTNAIKTCYPFNFYNTKAAGDDPLPSAGSGIIVGRDLAGAYTSMGAKALAISNAITSPTSQGFDVAARVTTVL